MRKFIVAAALGIATATAAGAPAIAIAPGLLGYEGQPGNQGGNQGGDGGGSKTCSPGQHGNPSPGFKPGSCTK